MEENRIDIRERLEQENERLKMKIIEITEEKQNKEIAIEHLKEINRKLQAENELFKNLLNRVKSIKFKE